MADLTLIARFRLLGHQKKDEGTRINNMQGQHRFVKIRIYVDVKINTDCDGHGQPCHYGGDKQMMRRHVKSVHIDIW